MIPELLKRWAAKRPLECRLGRFGRYEIGEYQFGLMPNGSLYAVLADQASVVTGGQPALDWLRGAVERVATDAGAYFSVAYWPVSHVWHIEFDGKTEIKIAQAESLVEAVLTAYVEYVEGQDG